MTGPSRRPARVLAGLALALLPLTSCGEPSIEDYCGTMQQNRRQLASMVSDQAGPGALIERLPLLRRLDERAPEDLRDEWGVFLPAVEGLARALRRADVSPGQFRDGKPPAGTSAADRTRITDAATRLAGPDVIEAATGIEQQARDVCKVNFGT